MESTTNPAPEWVYKRDGRLVPFEADKISRSLFAAGESLGRPDAFMARELTDGVLHFLAAEANGTILTTAQVGDLVSKVIRELGQPALAQAFADFSERHAAHEEHAKNEKRKARMEVPDLSLIASRSTLFDPVSLVRRAGGACLKAYALRETFSRDLAAAHADGLVVFGGLEAPFELSGWLLGAPVGKHMIEALEQARTIAGEYLAIDGPEYVVAGAGSVSDRSADYVRELAIGLRTTGLQAVVNLNGASPPFWAGDLAEGPLFAQQRRSARADDLAALADHLLDQLVELKEVRIDWHLGERDLSNELDERLRRLARHALEGGALTFTFDRPRRPIALAEGIDRQHPAVLLTVGLNLPQLQSRLGNRQTTGNPAELFLKKLGSLVRLALSAGVQKRAFLRRHDRSWPAFLLDRARLVVVPIGLEAVVRQLQGDGICGGLDLPRRIVGRVREVLTHDGRACHLDCCLDAVPNIHAESTSSHPQQTGVTPWDGSASVKQQLISAGELQDKGGQGTVTVLLPEAGPGVEVMADLLRWTWRQTEIVRVRFLRAEHVRTQVLAPWEQLPVTS